MSYFTAAGSILGTAKARGAIDSIVEAGGNVEARLTQAIESGAVTAAQFEAYCAKLGHTQQMHGSRWDDECLGAIQRGAPHVRPGASFVEKHKTELLLGGAGVAALGLLYALTR